MKQYHSLGMQLRLERVEAGLHQKTLGPLLGGATQALISWWESGRYMPGDRYLVKGSSNGNKVFLLTPFHQILSHILHSSGQFHIPFHQTLYFNYCLANGHRLPLKISRNALD